MQHSQNSPYGHIISPRPYNVNMLKKTHQNIPQLYFYFPQLLAHIKRVYVFFKKLALITYPYLNGVEIHPS